MYKVISDNFLLRLLILLLVIPVIIYCIPEGHSHEKLMEYGAIFFALLFSLPINLFGFFIRRFTVGRWSASNVKRGFAVELACTIFCVGAILVSNKSFGGPWVVAPWYPLHLVATGIHACSVLYINKRSIAAGGENAS